MVGQAPSKNTGKSSGGNKTYKPPQRLVHSNALQELSAAVGGTDRLRALLDQIDADAGKSTSGGDVSGSGHDGSSAGGAGVVPASSQASNTGKETGLTPKPPGPGIVSFADIVSRGGMGQTSSGGAGIAPGSSQASNTGNTRHTGSNPKPSGSGIGNYAPAVRHGGRDKNSSGKGKSSGGISKGKYPKGNGQKSQPAPAPAPAPPRVPLNWVKETYEEVYFDEKNSRVAKRLVNASLRGGHQSRIASNWHDSIRGNVTSVEDIAELYAEGTKMWFRNSKAYYVTITPVDDDHFKLVKANATHSQITLDNGRTREGKVAIIPQLVTREPVASGDQCPICGKRSHDFTLCLKAPKGYIVGCPVCSSRDHKLDDCQAFNDMSLAEKVTSVVTQRGSMPAFQSSKPWYMWLHEHCNSPGFTKSEAITAFPWSKPFAIKFRTEQNGNKLAAVQKSFDADPSKREVLPQDPATRSYKAIFNTYWKPAKLAWPQAIGNLDAQDEEMDDAQDEEEEIPAWNPGLPSVGRHGTGVDSFDVEEDREDRIA
ncbi:hypothetical protein BKA59DRAFT_505938 [Fusarium tricinctum]|uniref:Uncharacterized protein n=1 Tax=Fusarium tricinctum TaxID=61284 RepID=A0A8K0WI15_9HYPO|nr:hypothetical protein BKA59DRAFT_505938 [Fusarium tricinctum]